MWFRMIGEARGRVSVRARDTERETLEDINLAAVAASQVVEQAAIEMSKDQILQAELIGNGAGIPSRVENWVLSVARDASPDLFDVREGDPSFQARTRQRDHITAQLVKMSIPLADKLMKQYVREVNSTNEETASHKIDAAFVGALTGNYTTPEDLATDIASIGGDLTSHMTEGDRAKLLNESVGKAIRVAASGGLERDVPTRIMAVETILAASGLSELDRSLLRSRFQDSLREEISKGYIDAAKERVLTASKTQIDTDPASPFFGQRRSDLPDPDAAVSLAFEENAAGESGYHQTAREYLAGMGLSADDDNLIVRDVMAEVDKMVSRGLRSAAGKIEKEQQVASFLTNKLGGSAKEAWETSPAFESQSPIGITESGLARIERWLPEDQRGDLNRLAGSPIDNVPETRTIRAAVWGALGREASAATNYQISEELLLKVNRDWTAGDPEDMWNAINFYRQLGNKQDFLKKFGEKAGLNAAVAMNIAANKMFKARKSGPVPDWAEVTQDAQNIMAKQDILSRESRRDPAVDAMGRRLFREEGGKLVEVSRRQQALVEIMAAIQQTDLLVDPLNLHPDKDLDVYFGVPKDEPGLFAKGVGLLARGLVRVGSGGILRVRDVPRIEDAADSDPAAVSAILDEALQGFGEASTDNLLDVYFGLRASGSSVEDSAHGVVGFMANAGLTIADTGSGPKIRFDPLGALGPNRQDYAALQADVNVWLDRQIPADDWIRLNSKFMDAGRRFKAPGFFAVKFRDIPHLTMPHRFLSPESPNWTPPKWRFATEEAAWLVGVQNAGAPLMFLTQDANPEWVMLTDPRTNMPIFGFNHAELSSEGRDIDRVWNSIHEQDEED